MARPELSLVIPIYNEEEVLPQLDERVKALLDRLGLDCEVVFVDDGSKDRSMMILRDMAAHEPRYKVASFSRNFGHQRAITAGMDLTRGKAVVVMDADLQDPPEVILDMVAKWREGYDVVYGKRRSRAGETAFKLLTAKLFYRAFAAMIPIQVPLDTGDFRLVSRRVIVALKSLRESHRFIRGLVSWIGFKQTAVEYDRHARAAGETKYPLKKMLAFAADGIASFSVMPLRMSIYLGIVVGFGSILYAIAAVITWALGHTIPGWTTTVLLVSSLFSVQFLIMGVLGEYVGRIYEQLKLRPLYIVAEKINFEHASAKKKKRRASAKKTGAGVVAETTVPKPELPAPKPVRSVPPPEATAQTVVGVPAPPIPGPPAVPSIPSKPPPAPTPLTPSVKPPATASKPAMPSVKPPPVPSHPPAPPAFPAPAEKPDKPEPTSPPTSVKPPPSSASKPAMPAVKPPALPSKPPASPPSHPPTPSVRPAPALPSSTKNMK